MIWKTLRVTRELSVESVIIDRETQNTRDYKKLNMALLKCGLMRSCERVVAMELSDRGECGVLSVIVA